MTRTRTLPLVACLLALSACLDPSVRDRPASAPVAPIDTLPLDTSGTATFLVASDLHFLSPRLVETVESPALASLRVGDRKMLLQGPALLHSLLDSIRLLRPTFVLLAGDLTKDGELASHEDMADSLQTLVDAGIRVVVVPGNHDVAMNPEAYTATGSVSTPGVSAATFARLYRNFGYGAAISRDSFSLSYVIDVARGLRVVALDACASRDNAYGATSKLWGVLLPGTRTWLWKELERARRDGVDLVGLIHFNMVEHFEGESTESISNGYMLSDYDSLARRMAEAGLHVVFTGHFHASDVSTIRVGSSMFTDVETGSLITPPNRFRTGAISQGTLVLRGHRVREIAYDLGDTDFVAYADSFLFRGMSANAANVLTWYGLSPADASTYAGLLARAWMAHYAGDEPSPIPAALQERIDAWNADGHGAAARVLRTLSTDLPPADLETSFSIR